MHQLDVCLKMSVLTLVVLQVALELLLPPLLQFQPVKGLLQQQQQLLRLDTVEQPMQPPLQQQQQVATQVRLQLPQQPLVLMQRLQLQLLVALDGVEQAKEAPQQLQQQRQALQLLPLLPTLP